MQSEQGATALREGAGMSTLPRPEGSTLHERVLRRDKVVPVEVFETFADRIISALLNDYRCEKELAYDAMVDAVLAYLKTPENYDPGKGSLITYLIRIAKRRLVDRRRSLDAMQRGDQNFYERGVENPDRNPKDKMEDFVEAKRLLKRFLESGKLKTAQEVEYLRHLLRGEKSTQILASALGLGPMSWEKLQLEVKRQRDRILKALERFGKDDEP